MSNKNRSGRRLLNRSAGLRRELDSLKKHCRTIGGIIGDLPCCSLFEENPMMLFTIDEKAVVHAVNQKGGAQLGYEPRELIGRSVLEVFHPEDREAAREHVAESIENPDKTLSWELRKMRKDGTIIWVKEFAKPIKAIDGTLRVYIACEDITVVKRIQDALKGSEERYRHLVQNANSIILKLDTEGSITFFNEFAQDFFGFNQDQIIGKKAIGTIVPETESSGRDLLSLLQDILKDPERYLFNENENVKKNGERVWVSWRNKVIYDAEGRFTGILSVGQDITERKRTEEALARTEAEFEAIFNSLHDAAIFVDTERRIVLTNPAFTAQFGYTFEEVKGRTTEFLYADPADYEDQGRRRFNTGGTSEHHAYNVQYRRKDGSRFWSETSGVQVKDVRGTIMGFAGISRDITARKRAEEELKASEWRLEFATRVANEAIWDWDLATNRITRNEIYFTRFGRPSENQDSVEWWKNRIHPEDAERVLTKFAAILSGEQDHMEIEYRFQLADGNWATVHERAKAIRNEEGRVIRVIGSMLDITSRKKVEQQLQKEKELSDALNRVNSVIHSSLDFDTIMQRAIVEAAKALDIDSAALGLLKAEHLIMRYHYNMPDSIVGQKIPVKDLRGIQHAISTRDAVAFNDTYHDERLDPGTMRKYQIRSMMVAPLFFRGTVVGAMNFFCRRVRTFTEAELDFIRKLSASLSLALENARLYKDRKDMEEEMRHMAHHDSLTGLPNRRFFTAIAQVELAQARRNVRKAAIMFLDLDRFKEINDVMGHETGDAMLKQVAERLKAQVRESDTIARIGGDEFNILLPDLVHVEDSALIARKIIHAVQKPYTIEGNDFQSSASIGISVYPDDATELDTLLRYADIAMYYAKEQGRNNFQFYDQDINVRTLERIRLENSLQQSLERGELDVYYQPQIDMMTGCIVNAEALVRWRHPELGLLEPKQFLSSAEDSGFIVAIDKWMLRTACSQAKVWLDSGLPSVCVTVNLSARHFQDPELVRKILETLRETGLPGECLDLEITETVAMSNIERTIARLNELVSLGVHVSIDDFGTGYSSLNYLKRLPIQKLKIDQSFIRDIARDSDDRAIIKAVIAMAHSMKITVLAEGVETKEQMDFLRMADCDEVQGFAVSRPLSAAKFGDFMKQNGDRGLPSLKSPAPDADPGKKAA